VNAAATQGLSDEEVAAFMRITATMIQNLQGDTGGTIFRPGASGRSRHRSSGQPRGSS
jgi:hypothetical protein